MAAITSATLLYQSSDPGVRVVLLAVRKVTTGDTIDVGSVPAAIFGNVYSAATVCPTNRTQGAGAPTIAGTVITFAQSGLSADGVDLLVVGEAPQ